MKFSMVLLLVFLGACTPRAPIVYVIDFLDTTGAFSKTISLEPKLVEGNLVTFNIPCADVFDYKFTLVQQKGILWGAENTVQFEFHVPESSLNCPDKKEFAVKLDLLDLVQRISEKEKISPFQHLTLNGQKIVLLYK